jgi:CheY-like chemotaxis protein
MTARLAGRRILVIEDEYFVASDLKRALLAEGAHVVGPTADAARGLALAKDDGIDAAILDVNLEGVDSYPIADALAQRGVPYLFVTGYDGWAMPEKYRDAPRLGKPFNDHAVADEVVRLTGEPR